MVDRKKNMLVSAQENLEKSKECISTRLKIEKI
jgi:hypothetical protein